MKKTEYLVTRIGGVEPPTPLSEDVENSFAVSVANDVWYFYNKDEYIFCRRIIGGNLEAADVRVCQGTHPIALYNPPNVYLFFERDSKIFVKIISETATQAQITETDQQDNLISQPFRKYNYDATYYTSSLREKDIVSVTVNPVDTFSVSGISYSYISEETMAVIFINALSASFIYKNNQVNYIYGMLVYTDALGNMVPVWTQRRKLEKEADYFVPGLPKRQYSIIYYPDETTTDVFQIHYNIYYPHTTGTPNTFRDIRANYTYSLREKETPSFSITTNYNFLKQNYSEPNQANYAYSLREKESVSFSITANYNFLKQNYSEPNYANYTYSLREKESVSFSEYPRLIEVNIGKTSVGNFTKGETASFIRGGSTVASGVINKKDGESILYVSLNSGSTRETDSISGVSSGATGIISRLLDSSYF